ncbi:hypothetical protein B0T26DRAFT_680639 [Lasiosphaeria miniovina]|uniref:Uncharacterized protein n=1 Tax=Lasiosphaeria miniovina TaxID=1954250 RepID=A0AA40A0L1_9PEZI|nr:uncharacterized protein B0T26DRAFT_680639 [Lasiosphaeria miniovina]KAK0707065.1 hypothetical protein B0T26DRAFT_680639 [Lasiosphaeria miniovina]
MPGSATPPLCLFPSLPLSLLSPSDTTIPARGFLGSQPELSTYKRRYGILRDISEPRLQRSSFAVRTLRLANGARYLDMALWEGLKLLDEGVDLIEEVWDRSGHGTAWQSVVLNSLEFQSTCGSAKRAILDLERKVYDDVLSELQRGMVDSTKEIYYAQLIDRVKEVWCGIKNAYKMVTSTYHRMFGEEKRRSEVEAKPGHESVQEDDTHKSS